MDFLIGGPDDPHFPDVDRRRTVCVVLKTIDDRALSNFGR